MVNLLFKLKNKTRRDENGGGIFILYFMLFPLVFSVFGLAVDSTLATFTQTSIQSNLDAATQSALSHANNPGKNGNKTGKPYLSPADTRDFIIRTYDFNRYESKEQPFIRCQTSIMPKKPGASGTTLKYKLVSPPSGCNWTETSYDLVNYKNQISARMSIAETSNTIFLGILGFNEFKYYIDSESRITYQQG